MNSKEYALFLQGQINHLCSKLEELYSDIGMNIGYSDKPTVSLYKNKDEVRELISNHLKFSYSLTPNEEGFDVTLDSNPSLDDLIIYDGKVSVGGIRQSITELGLEFYLIKKVTSLGEKAMFNSDLDVLARTGFPQTAERIKEALRQKDEEIQTLRAAKAANANEEARSPTEIVDAISEQIKSLRAVMANM